jgi:hypothetical protein
MAIERYCESIILLATHDYAGDGHTRQGAENTSRVRSAFLRSVTRVRVEHHCHVHKFQSDRARGHDKMGIFWVDYNSVDSVPREQRASLVFYTQIELL